MAVLLLDVDGVVVTGHKDGGRWDQHLERDLFIAPKRLQARFFRPHWQKIMTGETAMLDVLERIWPEIGCAASARDFVDYWFASDSRIDAEVIAEAATWRAKNGKVFLATNQEHHRAGYLWKTLGLGAHFDGMFYSAALGTQKPDALFFRKVQEKLGVARAGEILFLDDSPKNVDGATALGWRAHHYRGIADLRAVLEDLQPSP